MIHCKLWQRYFLKETLKIFFLFLFCFYGLYVIIDYASRTGKFFNQQEKLKFLLLFQYYFYIFISRMEIIIPLGLLLGTIKTLCSLNVRREFISLLSAGVSFKTLLRPFLFLGLFFTFLMYTNEQFLLPIAEKKIKDFEDLHRIQKRQNAHLPVVRSILLKDQSKILFQSYHKNKQSLFDAYWIRSFNDLYRFQFLYPYREVVSGKYVDHFIRDESGKFILLESFEEKEFPEIILDREILHDMISSPSEFSLTELFFKRPKKKILDEKESALLTTLYWKLIIPWLSFFVVIFPSPFCIQFKRHLPIFFITALSLFGLIAYYLLLDCFALLAKRQVIPPFLSLFGLTFFLFLLGCRRFGKIGIAR